MDFPGLRRPTFRLLTVTVWINLIGGCGGGSHHDKAPEPTPVPPAVNLVQNCGEDFKDGESRPLKLFRSEFAPLGQTCDELAFEGQETCAAGQKTLSESGSSSCEETSLDKLSIVLPTANIEIGSAVALSLEGLDNRGGRIVLENKKARWSSSNDLVTISASGVVSSTTALKDVQITARYEGFTARIKLSILGKSCGETLDGGETVATRYKTERVAFGERCIPIDAPARCENGNLTFSEPMFEGCDAAKLTRLEAQPTTLYLKRGETAEVRLVLLDELGTQIPVAADEASWELPAGVLRSAGRISASEELREEAEVKISAQGLSTTLFVKSSERKPKLIAFKDTNLVLKAGDERTLEIQSSESIEAGRLNWSSSDSTIVSVGAGKIKALKAGGSATIKATLDSKTIALQVSVEDALSWEIKPVLYTANQKDVSPLTQDKAKLYPAYTLNLSGAAKPMLTGATEGCFFELRQIRGKWELDAELDEAREVLPNKCEVDVTAETKAGQRLTQKLSIPVDYNRVTVVESQPQQTPEGLDVAKVTLRMSSSYSVESSSIKPLSTTTLPGCSWSLLAVDGGYRVLVTREKPSTCAAQLVLKMKDANDGLVLTTNELIVASDDRPFEAICLNPETDAIKATVSAVRKALAQNLSCDRLSDLLRANSLAVLSQKKTFSLALDNKDLTDISPLSRLVGLTELSLAANRKLANIEPLRNLKQLKLLNLKFTAVKDFSPIYSHKAQVDLRLPVGASIKCSADILNPEINKICQE
jgi:hypothetical protein